MRERLDIPGTFGELIRQAAAAFGQRAVVRVDEYDKPVLDTLTDPDALRAHVTALFNTIPQPVEADVSPILAEHQHGARRRGRRVPPFPSPTALENGGAPCPAHDNNPIARYEGCYASAFYSHLAALGLDLTPEDANNHGRIDPTRKFNERIWLFAFKVVELCPAGTALEQRKARRYADEYRGLGQPIHLIGIEFSRAQRTVVGFGVEDA